MNSLLSKNKHFYVHSICFNFGNIVDCTLCSQSEQTWTSYRCDVEKKKFCFAGVKNTLD